MDHLKMPRRPKQLPCTLINLLHWKLNSIYNDLFRFNGLPYNPKCCHYCFWSQTGHCLSVGKFYCRLLKIWRKIYSSVVHHLNFRANEWQRSCLYFAIIKFPHSKTVASWESWSVTLYTLRCADNLLQLVFLKSYFLPGLVWTVLYHCWFPFLIFLILSL